MKGIIIAGGFGTRLRPLTYSRPKHLLPVANRPFLEYQVSLLKQSGVEEIIFATNYFADLIEVTFGDGSRYGVRMRYALEQEPLGTAGAIRNAAELAPGEPVLVLNGDILTDFDLGEVIRFHRERGAAATIALRPVARPHAFGALATDGDGRVRSWHEPTEAEKKAVAANPGPPTGEVDYINAGVYVLERRVVDSIPAGRPVSIERETFPALIASGAGVYGTAPEGFWLDIGRPDQYLAGNAAVLTGAVRTNVQFEQVGDGAVVAPDAEISAETSIGPGCWIGPGCRVGRSILLAGVKVGAGCAIEGAIVDERARFEDDCSLRAGVVIAAESVLGKSTRA